MHVGDQQAALAVEAAVVRLAKLRLGAGAAVAAEAFDAGAGQGGDDAGFAVHLADDGGTLLNDVHIAIGVDRHGVGGSDDRLERRAAVAIAGPDFLAAARDGGDDSRLKVQLADTVVAHVANVEVACTVEVAVERIVQQRRGGVAAVAAETLFSSAGHAGDNAGAAFVLVPVQRGHQSQRHNRPQSHHR